MNSTLILPGSTETGVKQWQNFQAFNKAKTCIEQQMRDVAIIVENSLDQAQASALQAQEQMQCVANLGRVVGVLNLMDCHELALLVDEVLGLLQDAARLSPDDAKQQITELYQLAFVVLTDFPAMLEGVFSGRITHWQGLSQLFNRIRKARGRSLVFSSQTLLTKRAVNFSKVFADKPEHLAVTLEQQLRHYAGIKKQLHSDGNVLESVRKLHTLFFNLEVMSRDYRLATLWGLCAAIAEALPEDQATLDNAAVKLLCSFSTIMQMVKDKGVRALGQNIPEEIMARILDVISGPNIPTERLCAIKCWFRLDLNLAGAWRKNTQDLLVAYNRKDAFAKVVRLLTERMGRLSDEINEEIAGESPSSQQVRKFTGELHGIQDTIAALGMTTLVDLLATCTGSSPVDKGEAALSEETLTTYLDTCAQTLYRCELFLQRHAEELERAVFVSSAGKHDSTALTGGKLSIALEAIKNIEQVVFALNDCAEAEWDTSKLADVPKLLSGAGIALKAVPLATVAGYCAAAARFVDTKLTSGTLTVQDPAFDSVTNAFAHLIISVILYLEQVSIGRLENCVRIEQQCTAHLRIMEMDDSLVVAASSAAESVTDAAITSEVATETTDNSVADASVNICPDIAELPAGAGDDVDSATLAVVSVEVADTSVEVAGQVETDDSVAVAARVADMPAGGTTDSGTDNALVLSRILADVAIAAGGTADNESYSEAVASPDSTHTTTDEDNEIRSIFIEEALELLAQINDCYGVLTRHPDDTEALTTMRRSYHTLKGSGRMVGAEAIGALAWSIENLLNNIIGGRVQMDAPVLNTLGPVSARLQELVTDFQERLLSAFTVASVTRDVALIEAFLVTETPVAAPSLRTTAVAPVVQDDSTITASVSGDVTDTTLTVSAGYATTAVSNTDYLFNTASPESPLVTTDVENPANPASTDARDPENVEGFAAFYPAFVAENSSTSDTTPQVAPCAVEEAGQRLEHENRDPIVDTTLTTAFAHAVTLDSAGDAEQHLEPANLIAVPDVGSPETAAIATANFHDASDEQAVLMLHAELAADENPQPVIQQEAAAATFEVAQHVEQELVGSPIHEADVVAVVVEGLETFVTEAEEIPQQHFANESVTEIDAEFEHPASVDTSPIGTVPGYELHNAEVPEVVASEFHADETTGSATEQAQSLLVDPDAGQYLEKQIAASTGQSGEQTFAQQVEPERSDAAAEDAAVAITSPDAGVQTAAELDTAVVEDSAESAYPEHNLAVLQPVETVVDQQGQLAATVEVTEPVAVASPDVHAVVEAANADAADYPGAIAEDGFAGASADSTGDGLFEILEVEFLRNISSIRQYLDGSVSRDAEGQAITSTSYLIPVHTLHGNCRLAKLDHIGEVVGQVENLLEDHPYCDVSPLLKAVLSSLCDIAWKVSENPGLASGLTPTAELQQQLDAFALAVNQVRQQMASNGPLVAIEENARELLIAEPDAGDGAGQRDMLRRGFLQEARTINACIQHLYATSQQNDDADLHLAGRLRDQFTLFEGAAVVAEQPAIATLCRELASVYQQYADGAHASKTASMVLDQSCGYINAFMKGLEAGVAIAAPADDLHAELQLLVQQLRAQRHAADSMGAQSAVEETRVPATPVNEASTGDHVASVSETAFSSAGAENSGVPGADAHHSENAAATEKPASDNLVDTLTVSATSEQVVPDIAQELALQTASEPLVAATEVEAATMSRSTWHWLAQNRFVKNILQMNPWRRPASVSPQVANAQTHETLPQQLSVSETAALHVEQQPGSQSVHQIEQPVDQQPASQSVQPIEQQVDQQPITDPVNPETFASAELAGAETAPHGPADHDIAYGFAAPAHQILLLELKPDENNHARLVEQTGENLVSDETTPVEISADAPVALSEVSNAEELSTPYNVSEPQVVARQHPVETAETATEQPAAAEPEAAATVEHVFEQDAEAQAAFDVEPEGVPATLEVTAEASVPEAADPEHSHLAETLEVLTREISADFAGYAEQVTPEVFIAPAEPEVVAASQYESIEVEPSKNAEAQGIIVQEVAPPLEHQVEPAAELADATLLAEVEDAGDAIAAHPNADSEATAEMSADVVGQSMPEDVIACESAQSAALDIPRELDPQAAWSIAQEDMADSPEPEGEETPILAPGVFESSLNVQVGEMQSLEFAAQETTIGETGLQLPPLVVPEAESHLEDPVAQLPETENPGALMHVDDAELLRVAPVGETGTYSGQLQELEILGVTAEASSATTGHQQVASHADVELQLAGRSEYQPESENLPALQESQSVEAAFLAAGDMSNAEQTQTDEAGSREVSEDATFALTAEQEVNPETTSFVERRVIEPVEAANELQAELGLPLHEQIEEQDQHALAVAPPELAVAELAAEQTQTDEAGSREFREDAIFALTAEQEVNPETTSFVERRVIEPVEAADELQTELGLQLHEQIEEQVQHALSVAPPELEVAELAAEQTQTDEAGAREFREDAIFALTAEQEVNPETSSFVERRVIEPVDAADELQAALGLQPHGQIEEQDQHALSAAPPELEVAAVADVADVVTVDGGAPANQHPQLAGGFILEAKTINASIQNLYAAFRRDGTYDRNLAGRLRDQFTLLERTAALAAQGAIAPVCRELVSAYQQCADGSYTASETVIILLDSCHAHINACINSLETGERVETSAENLQAELQLTIQQLISLRNEASIQDAEDKVEDELLAVFIEEAGEILQELDSKIADWQQAPDDKSILDDLLRSLHTLKGSAALVGEKDMSESAHRFETCVIDAGKKRRPRDVLFFAEVDRYLNVLQVLFALYQADENGRLVKRPMTRDELVTLMRMDAAQKFAEHVVAAAQAVRPVEDKPVQQTAVATPEIAAFPAAAAPPAVTDDKAAATHKNLPGADAQAGVAADEHVRVSANLLKSLLNDADEISIARNRVEQTLTDVQILMGDMEETLGRIESSMNSFEFHAKTRAGIRQAETASGKFLANSAEAGLAREFDALEMDKYTELQQIVLSLLEDYNDVMDIKNNVSGKIRSMGTILVEQQRSTNKLQEGLVSSQMVPFAGIAPRLRRLVRQVSADLDKQVTINFGNPEGKIDRSVLQALVNPIEHMIRNAIDHGIESTMERLASGKQGQGELQVKLYRQGANIILDIVDDGRGINTAKVRQKAIAQGLLAENAELSEQELCQFILRAGFSTSDTVSHISGRGVGLDVVLDEITQIGGDIEISSRAGLGTTFRIRLPLTSSLNRALLFNVSGADYVMLLNTIDGIVLEKNATLQRAYRDDKPSVFQYGDKSYELAYLGSMLDEHAVPEYQSGNDTSSSLVLVSGNGKNLALHVDSVIGSRELVVKSLGPQFAGIPVLTGGVILGDGRVVVVLDPRFLVDSHLARKVIPVRHEPAVRNEVAETEFANGKTVMVVDDSITVRKVTSAILKRNGMNVILAKNGIEAVELLQTTRPDIMLLDIEMPKMDGFEVAAYVRRQENGIRNLPIIMITSRIGEKHRSRAEEIGVNQYMCKPFQETNLLEAIAGYN